MITDEELRIKRECYDKMREITHDISNDYQCNPTILGVIEVSILNLQIAVANLADEVLTLRKEMRDLESSLDTLGDHSCSCSCERRCTDCSDQITFGDLGDFKGQ